MNFLIQVMRVLQMNNYMLEVTCESYTQSGIANLYRIRPF